eukprot:GHVH01010618.1.p1 GENE.GHVH01010618.1~~GHVH01010618.1.p1  ORF type:complete len:469 (+),score=81.28 GHVH01010618.1:34-1407(+)
MSKAADMPAMDPRPHLNVVFVGHVDAGKSTTCGNILVLSGNVDERVLQRYEREAKEKNREGWYLAYVFDLTDEEREKGKTVEVGRATFELENTRFTILDAPGHKSFVPNMIAGAAQADIGVLIISARKGEFEAGFDRSGQTREHALLCKTLGVQHLIVAVNKMDESTCDWDKKRYDSIVESVVPFLKRIGFPPAQTTYVPIAGLSGQNVMQHVSDPSAKCYEPKGSWYPKTEPTLLEIMDECRNRLADRQPNAPLRIPILEMYKDQGVMAIGKVECGTAKPGMKIVAVPSGKEARIDKILLSGKEDDEIDVPYALPGENVCLKLTGIGEDDVPKGAVFCSIDKPILLTKRIKIQGLVVELLEHRPLLTAGYKCVFHAHTLVEDCTVEHILETIDTKSKKKILKPPFAKGDQYATIILSFEQTIAVEDFKDNAALGRFTLRDENTTIAIGKIVGKIVE